VLGGELAENLKQFRLNYMTQKKIFKTVRDPMPYGSVLIVDDMETNLFVAKGLMKFYQLQIDTAVNGYEAIEKVKEGKVYDIIFMDHMMPDINGIEATKVMRRIGYANPIVALTANALIGQAEEFARNGFDGFISKPIQGTHLNGILNKFIRDKQPQEVLDEVRAGIGTKQQNIGDFLSSTSVHDKICKDLIKNHRNVVGEVRQALEVLDFGEARALMHAVKSLIGLIDEAELLVLIENAEEAFRQSKMPDGGLYQLSRKMEEVLSSIEEKFKDRMHPKSIDPNDDWDKAAAKMALDKLADLLAANSSSAVDLLDDLAKIPYTETMIEQIDDFDFNLASESLIKLRKILEV